MNNYDLQKFKGDNPPILSNNLTEKSLSDTNNAITTLWKKESNLEYDLKNKKVKWDEINGIPSDIATHTALTVGIVGDSFPTITDNNNGSITISSCVCNLRTTNSFTSPIRTFKIASAILTATNNTEQYIMISYNNGYPIYILTSNLLLSNSCDYSAVAATWRIGNVVHYATFGQNGVGLSNKLNNRTLQTEPFKRWIWGGLDLTETATRVVNVSSSIVYSGATPLNVAAINSTTGHMYFVYHNAGNWVFTLNTQYNNIQYDNGTNLVTSSNNKYLVRYIYRSISSLHNDMFYISSNNHYNTLDLARAASIPTNLPAVVLRHCMLVGRIIVQYNLNTASAVESAFAQTFSYTPTGVTGNGTTGKIPLWTGSNILGDSPLNSPNNIDTIASGNIGIGKTSIKHSYSLYKTIEVGGNCSIIGDNTESGNKSVVIGNNWYVDASGNNKPIANGYVTLYEQYYGCHNFSSNSGVVKDTTFIPTWVSQISDAGFKHQVLAGSGNRIAMCDSNGIIKPSLPISSGTFTLTWQNFSTTITSSVSWQKIGKQVTMIFDAFYGNTTNSNLFYATGMPTDLCPLVRTPSGINMYSGLLSGAVDNNGTRENGCYAVVKYGGQIAIMLKSNIMFAPGTRGIYVDWPSIGDAIYGKITISYMMDR